MKGLLLLAALTVGVVLDCLIFALLGYRPASEPAPQITNYQLPTLNSDGETP